MALTWPFWILYAVFAPEILQVFGDGYIHAADVAVVLAITMMVASACGMADVVLIASGRTKASLGVIVAALATTVVLDLLLVPAHGAFGAALGWAGGVLVKNLLPLAQLSRTHRMILVTGLPRSGTVVGRPHALRLRQARVRQRAPQPRTPLPRSAERPGRSTVSSTSAGTTRQPGSNPFQDTLNLRFRWHAELPWPPSPARFLKYGASFAHGRLTGRKALLDDPFALWSAEWFADRLDCRVVILTRDPITFAGSWDHLGWTARPRRPAEPAPSRQGPPPRRGPGRRRTTAWRRWPPSGRPPTSRSCGCATPTSAPSPTRTWPPTPTYGFRSLYEWCGIPGPTSRPPRSPGPAPASPRRPPSPGRAPRKTAFRPTDSKTAAARSRLSAADAEKVSRPDPQVKSRRTAHTVSNRTANGRSSIR